MPHARSAGCLMLCCLCKSPVIVTLHNREMLQQPVCIEQRAVKHMSHVLLQMRHAEHVDSGECHDLKQ